MTAAPLPALRSAPRKAVPYMFAATTSLAVLDAGVKGLTGGYAVPEIAFLRYIVGLLLAVAVAARNPEGLRSLGTRRPVGHAVRSFCNLAAMLLFYYAISLMPLADAVALAFGAPVFTTIFSRLILHERVSPRRWIAVIVGFCGVLVMLRPGGSGISLGAVLALLSAVFFALTAISSRQLSLTETSHTILFYYSVVCLLATGAVLPWEWRTPLWGDVWIFVLVGVSGSLGQFLMNQAFRFGEASMLAPIDYTSLLWAAAFGYLFWSEVPSLAVLAGAALIVVSTSLAGTAGRRRSAADEAARQPGE